MTIDDPFHNDNRNYDFTSHPEEYRDEYRVISSMIAIHASVIDLGCGNGTLLQEIRKERSATVEGVELSPSGVQTCRAKGLKVLQGRIDEKLPFADNSFDYAICNVTMQMVMYPEVLLGEMKRIARYQIVSFPNFAFYRNRLQLLFRGEMPAYLLYGYRWYNTGHIHQFSLTDFKCLVHSQGGLTIRELCSVEVPNPIKHFLMKLFPNLLMPIPILLLEKSDRSPAADIQVQGRS